MSDHVNSTWVSDAKQMVTFRFLVPGQFQMSDSGTAVIPAETGIQSRGRRDSWTPAFAGVTDWLLALAPVISKLPATMVFAALTRWQTVC